MINRLWTPRTTRRAVAAGVFALGVAVLPVVTACGTTQDAPTYTDTSETSTSESAPTTT